MRRLVPVPRPARLALPRHRPPPTRQPAAKSSATLVNLNTATRRSSSCPARSQDGRAHRVARGVRSRGRRPDERQTSGKTFRLKNLITVAPAKADNPAASRNKPSCRCHDARRHASVRGAPGGSRQPVPPSTRTGEVPGRVAGYALLSCSTSWHAGDRRRNAVPLGVTAIGNAHTSAAAAILRGAWHWRVWRRCAIANVRLRIEPARRPLHLLRGQERQRRPTVGITGVDYQVWNSERLGEQFPGFGSLFDSVTGGVTEALRSRRIKSARISDISRSARSPARRATLTQIGATGNNAPAVTR
jgi:hypothetical protein